jgi:hypothetical protein
MPDAYSILAPLKIPESVKADAWDAANGATSADELTSKLKKLPLTDQVRADLWDSAQERLSRAQMTFGGFVKNAGSSGANLAKNVLSAVSHPLDTISSGADLAAGALDAVLAAGHEPGDPRDQPDPNAWDADAQRRAVDTFHAFATAMKDRYGSLDKLKRTLYTDPFGAAADVSAVLDGVSAAAGTGAEVADAAKLSRTAEAARRLQSATRTAAHVTNPVSLAVKGTVKAGAPVVGPLVRKVRAARTTLLPEEIAAPLQARADELSEAARQVGVETQAEIEAARQKVTATRNQEADRIAQQKAEGAATLAANSTRATEAAQALQSRFSEALSDAKFGRIDDVAKAAAGGNEHAGRVLEALRTAKTPDQIAQASIQLQDYRTGQTASGLYDKVGELVADHDLPDLPLSHTREVVRDLHKFLQKDLNPAANKNVARVIDGIRDAIGEATGEAPNTGESRHVQSTNAAPAVSISSGTEEQSAGANGGGTGPRAASPEPNRPGAPSTGGAKTIVTVPGSPVRYGARYEVRELADLQPSHNGITFEPNPKYAYRNDRTYGPEGGDRRKVITHAGGGQAGFDPAYHITDNPDAVNGPPLIDGEGNALGGNGRTMTLQRVYAGNPEAAAAYRGMLEERAAHFGIDPEQVRGMKQPVLVRVIDDEHLDTPAKAQNAITDFNKVGTAALTPAERAIADSRRVSQETLERVGDRLQELGPDATLAQALNGQSGIAILERLIADGVISPQDAGALRTASALTQAGKDRVAALMLGRFFRDSDQLEGLEAGIRNKLGRLAAPVAKTESEGAYDLAPHVRGAVDLLEQQRLSGSATLDDYLNQSNLQSGLFAGEQYSPESIALARRLKDTKATQLTAAVRSYAADARYAGDYQGPGLMGNLPEPLTPREAFDKAFSSIAPDETNAPTEQAQAAKEPTEAAPKKKPQREPADLSYQNVRRLDSSLGQMIRDGHTGDGAIIGNNGVQYLQQLRNAIRADLAEFAEGSDAAEVAAAAQAADEYYQQVRVPYKQLDVARAGTNVDSDRIFDSMIKAGHGDQAQRFYDALDDKGRAAVRSQMAMDAVNAATDNVHGTVDPRKLVEHLTKMAEPYGVFFRGMDKFELDGLRNIARELVLENEAAAAAPAGAGPAVRAERQAAADTMRGARERFRAAKAAAQDAEQAARKANENVAATNRRLEKYPLGASAAAALMTGKGLDLLGVPLGESISAAAGVATLVKVLTMTDAGRRFLLASSMLEPGSRAMSRLIAELSMSGPNAAGLIRAYRPGAPGGGTSPSSQTTQPGQQPSR